MYNTNSSISYSQSLDARRIKKTGDMVVGQVSFRNDKEYAKVFARSVRLSKARICPEAQKRIVNRLSKIEVGRIVDYEAEQIERVKRENSGTVSPRLPR